MDGRLFTRASLAKWLIPFVTLKVCPIKSPWINKMTNHYMFWTFETPREEYKLRMSNPRIIRAYCLTTLGAIHELEAWASCGNLLTMNNRRYHPGPTSF